MKATTSTTLEKINKIQNEVKHQNSMERIQTIYAKVSKSVDQNVSFFNNNH